MLKQIIMDCQVDKLGYRADVQWSLKAKWEEERDMIKIKPHVTDRPKEHICQKRLLLIIHRNLH